MISPTLSVLMPNYNHAKYIGEALKAILNQSYRPIEVIVIDDASTDNSIGIIREFVEHDPIIRLVVNEKNMGVVHNLNKLLELAKGDYVYFAAADDKILLGFFERSMNLLAQNPQAGLCSALTLIIDEENRNKGLHPTFIISRKECFVTPEKARRILKKAGNWIPGNTAILKRKALIDSGGFIPELHSFSDGFLYHVIALKYGFCFIPEPLVCWRRMDSGYAMSTGSNPDIMNEITRHAVNLMQTTYSELFSKEYIKDFEKVQCFLMNLNLLSSMREKKANSMGRKTAPFLKRMMFKVERISYVLYLFIRFRPRIFPIIARKTNRFFYLSKFCSSRKISVH
jgi:glycosyltransferase involved in cell wall biosynthesis